MNDLVFAPNHAGYDDDPVARLRDFREQIEGGRLESWTTRLSSEPGDLFLFWFGNPVLAVCGIGVFSGEVGVEANDGSFDWTEADRVFFGDYDPCLALRTTLTLAEMRRDPEIAAWWASRPFQGAPKTILKHPKAAQRLLKLIAAANPNARKIIVKFEKESKSKRPQAAAAAAKTQSLEKALAALPTGERERVTRMIEKVVREQRLRRDVLALWGGVCAACSLELRANSAYECEVAHLRPVADLGHDTLANALPLCRTHHWAFDNHIWGIRPSLVIDVRKEFRDATLGRLHGKRLRAPIGKKDASEILAAANLQWRWKAHQKGAVSR
jgi:HNH endonuclease